MPYKLSSSRLKKFLASYAEVEPNLFGAEKNSDALCGKVEKFLSAFVAEHNRDVALIALSHENAMERICKRGLDIKTVIDVGASDGHWSVMMKKQFFTDARFFLVEAYDVWREALEKRKQTNPDFDFVLAAAGENVGKIYLCKRPDHPTGGHAYHRKLDDRYEEIPQTCLDFEVEDKGVEGPFMVKLDCHGHEREILKGAAKTLEKTHLLMVEAYNYGDRGRMRFHELCSVVEEMGFRCVDIAEPYFMEESFAKNADHSFWQIDLFFVREDRPEYTKRFENL